MELQSLLAGWDVEITATDISVEMLNRARSGLYTQFEVQRGLPIATLVKYFKQVGEKWRLDAGVRSMVKFKEFNLLDDPAALGKFDIVFCRNVLIYFGPKLQEEVLGLFGASMTRFGILALGRKESLRHSTHADEYEPLVESEKIFRRR